MTVIKVGVLLQIIEVDVLQKDIVRPRIQEDFDCGNTVMETKASFLAVIVEIADEVNLQSPMRLKKEGTRKPRRNTVKTNSGSGWMTENTEMHSVVGFLVAWGCELSRLTLGYLAIFWMSEYKTHVYGELLRRHHHASLRGIS